MFGSDFVIGTCRAMCSDKEAEMRKRNKLLHFYEKNSNSSKLIAEYSRSAADRKQADGRDLRNFEALQETLEYLINTILLNPEKTYNFRYDFIFDRCRAIRQEIVIQNFSPKRTVKILEPIVMFLVFSLYRLNGSPMHIFDSKIATQHLQECLRKCLSSYEEIKMSEQQDYSNRIYIEGIYLLLNMEEGSALQRAFRLDSKLKSTFIIQSAIKISLNFHMKNFYKVLYDIQSIPHLICAIGSLKVPQIRKHIFQTFSIAYNSKVSKVPIDFLMKLLLYTDYKILISDLRELQIYEGNDENPTHVIFNKSKFDSTKSISQSHQHQFVEEKLKDYHLPDLLLLKTL